MTPLFYGSVVDGKLRWQNKRAVMEHVWSHDGHEVEVTIKRRRSQRSVDQNAYLHACVFGPLGEELGYTMSEMKLLILGEVWGWKDVAGHRLPIKLHTSELSSAEASHLIDWVIPWALEQFNFRIPLPNEVDYGSAHTPEGL